MTFRGLEAEAERTEDDKLERVDLRLVVEYGYDAGAVPPVMLDPTKITNAIRHVPEGFQAQISPETSQAQIGPLQRTDTFEVEIRLVAEEPVEPGDRYVEWEHHAEDNGTACSSILWKAYPLEDAVE